MASQRTAPLTLRHVLCQQKPIIRCKSKPRRNSIGVRWPPLKAITVWHDFTLENLNESYGHILDNDDARYPLDLLQVEILRGVETETDKDIGHLIGWNDALMQQTLQVAKSRLGIRRDSNLTYLYSTPDKSVIARLPNMSSKPTVDHVIGLDNPLEPVLVVGLGRVCAKWTCMKLLDELPEPSGEVTLPVQQLGNLCKKAGTRYGYIQTEEDLVACCFSDAGDGRSLTATIMPIPWTKHGPHMLTSELALWWLCMVAMSPFHSRSIQREQDMVKINEWAYMFHDARTILMRHQYSNFQRSMDVATPSMAFANLGSVSPGFVTNQHGSAEPVQSGGLNNSNNPMPADSEYLDTSSGLNIWTYANNSNNSNSLNSLNNGVDPQMLTTNQVVDYGSNQNTQPR